MRTLRGAVVILCAALVLGLTACAAPTAGPAADPPGATVAAVPGAPDALQFTGATVDGSRFDAATLAGTPVVLWFWAPF